MIHAVSSFTSSYCGHRLTLPEEPPSAPPQTVIASGRTNQSIMIQWQPPPESHQNGPLQGYIIRYGELLSSRRQLPVWVSVIQT